MPRKARSSKYVDTAVQGFLARRIVGHWCVFFGTSLFCLFGLECFLGDPNLSLGGRLASVASQYSFFIILMFAMIPVFVYDTIKVSNRFAGPIVRLRGEMKRLADGQAVGEVLFRDDDFWSDLSIEFNRVSKIVQEAQSNQTTSSASE